jgi:hypothetical protein
MQIDESDEHRQNACMSIRESWEPDSNVKLESAAHGQKQFSQRTSTADGMQIDESDEQPQNAKRSIREILQSDSNVKCKRLLQRKQPMLANQFNRRPNTHTNKHPIPLPSRAQIHLIDFQSKTI